MKAPLQSKTKTSSSGPPTFAPVQRGFSQRKCACGGTLGRTGECEACRKKRVSLQRRTLNSDPAKANGADAPAKVHEVLRSPSQPLDRPTRSFMEPRFGHDFSKVRVQTDAKLAESARAVNALSFTFGRDDRLGEETGQVAKNLVPMSVSFGPSQNATAPVQKKYPTCEAGGNCPKCSDNGGIPEPASPVPAALGPEGAVPMQAPPPVVAPAVHTYTFISRGSYGQTTPGFTQPSCAAGAAAGTATLVGGSASPSVTVFPNGTYQVRRDDGVVQTATCTRSAAGLAATTAHENSHAAGARAGATAANTAAGLPQNFADSAANTAAAQCAAALPGARTTWNATANAAWQNEVTHGPGTNPPTAQTFTQEHAAGSCTFV
jgi:Domain of unknown function (DUF4157)